MVDDTPETLGLLTDTLDHAGFTVLIATDGESALELLDQITPDLVLMDAVMPGMNGFESCRRHQAEKLLANLPVIFMTGLSESEHVIEGLAAGGVDYVTKPIVVDELLARIRVHLANARAAQGAGAALDATGRFLLATDRAGRVLWCTPKAKQLLAELFPAVAASTVRVCRALSSSCGCGRERDDQPRRCWISARTAGNRRAQRHRAGRVVVPAHRAQLGDEEESEEDAVDQRARVRGAAVGEPWQVESRDRRDPHDQPAHGLGFVAGTRDRRQGGGYADVENP